MILIFLNWMIIAYVVFMHGFLVRRYFIVDSSHSSLSITLCWGCCVVFFYAALFLFFAPAAIALFIILCSSAVAIHLFFRNEIVSILKKVTTCFSRKSAGLFLLLLLAMLALSAQPSGINDDALYYTQTVLWLTHFGFVKGIGNLQLPLGLTSSWHILQAVFSLSFIEGIRFNDLNGFLIVVLFIYYVERTSQGQRSLFFHIAFALTMLISIPFFECLFS